MSNQNEQNEELTRFSYDWFHREKEPPPLWRPDGEFINAREDPDHTNYRGIDAIRKQHQGWFDAYPDLHLEPLEIKANGDRVFVWVRFTGDGAESGPPWRWSWRTSRRSKAASSDECRSTPTASRRSQPWGCRIGRRRRRA